MIDLAELKKLSTEEKLRIIDELEASIEMEEGNSQIDTEIVEEMEQRYQDMLSGKSKSYTWEEAEAIWEKTLKNKHVHE